MKKGIVILLFSLVSLWAEEIKGTVTKDSITIGEPFQFSITLPLKEGQQATLDHSSEWIGPLRIRDIKPEGNQFIFTLSSYSAPTCSIPSFTFSVEGDTTKLTTAPLTVTILSELPDSGAVSKEFRTPLKAGKFPIYIIIIIAILLLILIGTGIYLSLRQKSKEEVIIPPTPPYEEAIEALLMLQKEKLLDRGEFKEFTFTLSDILKRYISRRFECHVQESTATEFKEWIGRSSLSGNHKKSLELFINETEPVKFANITPPVTTFEGLLKDVRAFCDQTKPQIIIPETEELKETKS